MANSKVEGSSGGVNFGVSAHVSGGSSGGNSGGSSGIFGGLQLGAGFDFKNPSTLSGKAGSGKATTDGSNPLNVRATIGGELVSSGLKKMEQANQMQSLVDTAKQTRGLMLGQWGDSREGAALTNRELTGDRGEDSAVEDEENIFSKTAQPKETTTGKVDSTVRPTAAALRPTAAALTPEQRQERKEEVRQQNAQLEQDYRELNSKILYGRIGRDYTEEDIERLNNLETQIQDNRDELKALQAAEPTEWAGRADLIRELDEIDSNSGYVTDPMVANQQAARRAEILQELERGDQQAGNGVQNYGEVDRSRNIFSGATKDYASGMVNNAGTGLQLMYEGVNTNPYAGWATDEMTAMQITPERNEEIMRDFEFLQTGAKTLQDTADQLGDGAAHDLERAKAGLGTLGQAGVDIATNVIQMGYDAGIGALLGGGHAGLIPMYLRSAGAGEREARLNGASVNEQFWFGQIKGGIEAGTELIGNGVGNVLSKVYGAGAADDIAEEVIRHLAGSDMGRSFLRLIGGAAGEGAEEALSDLLAPLAEKIYNREDSLGELYRNLSPSEIIYDYLIGAAIGGMGGATGILTGQNAAANAELRARDYSEQLQLGAQEQAAAYQDEQSALLQAAQEREAAAARAEEAARAAAAYQEEQSALLLAAQEHEAEAARARAAGAYQEEQDQLRLAGQARAEAEAKARAADAYQEEQNALLEAVQAREQAEELQKQAQAYQEEQDTLRLAQQERQATEERQRAAQAYQEEQDTLRLAQQETERRNGDVEEDEQVTAETESGLLEQEEAQPGEGEQPVRAGEADEDRAGTAAGTETAIRLAGEDLSDGSGRWDAGQRAGGEAGQLDRDAGTGSRDQGAGGSGRARTGESYGDALRKSGARQLSSREFGLERGTDTPTFYEITEDLLTDDLKQLRYGIGTSTGCSVEFVSGPMQVVGRNGRVQNIGGFYDPANRRIVVRADSRRYTAEQIARHEEFHALADLDPHLVDEIRDRITERFGRKEMERIVRGYQIARRGINDITSGVDAEAREAQELLEEIFADANGNMNAFGLGANRFAFNTWTTITNRENRRSQTANGTRETRGPPRYSDAGDGGTSNSTRVEPGPKVKDNNEKNDLAQVLVRNIQRLEIMQPVAELSGEEMNDRSKTPREQIMDFFDSIGNRVTRESFGDVALGTYGADAMINHRPLNRAKMVTIQAVPDVIRYGNLIGYDPNWKNRGYQTFIFGAPVTVAGKTVYVAAVVDQRENKEFYLNECVDSEGNYVRIVEGPTDSAKSGVTVQDGLTTGPVEPSENSVPQSQKESKQSFSATKEDPSGNTKSGVTVPDGLTREPDRSSEGPSDNTKIGLTVRNGITEGPLEPSSNSVPQSQDNSKQSFSVDEDEDRSGWNEDFRKRVEDTEELIDDLQEFYQSVDEYDENRLSQEELENYTDYNRYSRNVSMYGGSEITDSLNELAKDATGERRTEIFELMERMLPHLDELEQQRYTGDRNDPEWQPTAFSRWYNKRHPSLYYPGYQPGDLFDRGKADSWTAWDNQDREKEYLQGLIDSGKLMEPELTEAREFLERLENGSEVFYSTDDGYDPDYVQQVLDAAEERDALQERLNRIESRDGRYVDRESGTEFDEAEVRELAEALEAAENRYNELAAEAENHRTEEKEESEEEPEADETGLQLGKAEETEEEPGEQTMLPEDPKDRTIRELEAANRDLQKYADNWRKQASITGEGEETAKRSDVRRFTNELADEAEYQGERAELQQKVQRLSDMVVSNDRGDGLDWNEIRRQAREIAEDLVDNSYTVVDPEADTRKAILSDLKQMKIRPDREWTSDFGDWNSMRQRLVGKIIFNAKEGRSIDDVYQELRASYGEGLFPENITAGSDQLNRIIDALDQLRPSMNYNFASDQDAEMATQYYQNKITDEVLYGNIGPELTKADRNYRRVKERMRDAEQKLREVKKESRQKIEDLQKMQRHEVRAAVENQRKQVREREEKQKLRKKISQTGKRLIKYLTENNGQKNPIPEPLKEAVGKVLLDLDISGGMDVKQKKKYVQDMQQVARIVTQQNAYMEGNTDKWAGMYLDLPADIQQELDEHLQNVQKAMDEAEAKGKVWNPNMMGTEELQRLDEILTVLTSAITNSNEILSDARGAKISEEAAEGIREIDSLGTDRKRSERGESLNKFLRFQNTTPYYFFKRLGKAGMRMFERIQDGWDKFAFNARQVVDFANETYTEQEAREIQETVYEFQLRRRGDMSEGFEKPETVRMTKAQIMSLYCLWKREQARGHLTGAGIRIADFRDGKNKITQAENYLLDLDDVAKIISKLTDRDKQIADALQKYMNTMGSDWGNEVSMKRFGIRSFTEENYFPITTDDRTRPVRNPESDTANLYRLLNMSFTKSTQRGASNSVVIDNIFDVFANHMADMAKYNGLGLPMLDAMKWVSYNQTSELNEEGQYGYESVQKSMERAFGKEARTYFTTFMKDLNGVREGGRGEEFGSRMLSSYKVAAVGANIRVALLQPTSYVRAGAVLDKKYLVKGLGMSNKQGQEEARKWSGTAVWKDLGFYDTNINAGLREMIKHTDGLKGKIQEASMKGAELGDKMTWGALWNACKTEQTDRGFTGDELMQKTAERFREVVYRTQVMDSTMTRSHVMRQKGAYAGMVTAFMSEPTLSYNMLLDAYTEYENEVRKEAKGSTDKATLKKAREKAWEKAGPAVGKAATAYLATATLSAIVESVIDAARDDDEYANFLERFAEKLLGFNVKDPDSTTWEKIKGITSGNLMQDLLVHNKLPVVKDFFSILSGNDTSRMDTEWMNNIIRAGQIAWESLALRAGWIDEPTKITYNGNMTAWGKIYNILRGVSQVTGLPLGNAMRDLSAMWNSTVGEITGKKIQTYNPGPLKQIQYALKDGYITEDDAVKLLMEKELVDDEIEARQQAYVWANPEKYENMLAAMRAGDKEGFEAAKDQLEDLRYKQSSIMAAVTSEVKEMYLGTDGTEPISREEAMSLMMEYGGMIERKAETEIQKWTCELETGIPYDGIDEAYIAGDITREQAEKMLVEYGGYAEDKAAAQVQKWTSQVDEGIWYSEIDDYYFYGDITYKEAVDMYMKYGGMDRETAENTVLETKFLKDFGRERDRIELQDMYVSGEYDRDKMKEIMLEYGYSANENSAENSLIRWDFIGDDMSLDKVTPTQAKAYFNGLEDAEIDKHTYLDFATRAADIKADYDENGKSIMYSKMDKVLALIDSLDLSDEQKDALALIYGADGKGYAEKNLSRAPWHGGSTKKSTKKSGGRSGGGGGGRKKSRSGGGGGGGLSLPAVEAVDSGRGSYFDDILDQWRKRKLTRAEILKLLKEGKLTQKEADQILATLQEGDEAVDSTDRELLGSGLQLGAAEDADLLKEP